MDEGPHLFKIMLGREKFGPFRCIHPVKATVPGRRAGNAHVNLGGARIAHHLDNLETGCAANNGIVDKDHTLARNQGSVGIVLQFYAEVTNLIARLDEGSPHIM